MINSKHIGIIILLLICAKNAYAGDNSGQLIFQQKCAGCHSVSGHRSGNAPDLQNASSMGDNNLRKAIVRMQSNAGPLNSQQINDIMSYLKSLSSNNGSNQSNQTMQPSFPQGMPGNLNLPGASLYCGNKSFINGGPACISCHTINGYGSGPALFKVARHASKCMNSDFLLYPRNRAMANAYGNSPLTRSEAMAIGQYLQSINGSGMMGRFGGGDDGGGDDGGGDDDGGRRWYRRGGDDD